MWAKTVLGRAENAVRRPRSHWVASVAAVAMLGMLLVGTADAADSSCVSGDFCISEGCFWGQPKYTTPGSIYDYWGLKYPGTDIWLDNSASSVYNHGQTLNVRLYNERASGSWDCVALGSVRFWLWYMEHDDTLSRHTWTSSSYECY